MKTTTKLWIAGITSGVITLIALMVTTGYVIGSENPSTATLILIAAFAQCLGFFAAGSCLSAAIVKVLQEDQSAGAVLRDVERRVSGGTLVPFRRDG